MDLGRRSCGVELWSGMMGWAEVRLVLGDTEDLNTRTQELRGGLVVQSIQLLIIDLCQWVNTRVYSSLVGLLSQQ